MPKKIEVGIVESHLDYAIINPNTRYLVAVSFFDRAAARLRSMSANMTNNRIYLDGELYHGMSCIYKGYLELIPNGRDRIVNCLSVAKEVVNRTYIISTKENLILDIKDYLLRNYTLPILEEWIPFLISEMEIKRGPGSYGSAMSIFPSEKSVITDDYDRCVKLNGKSVKLQDVVLVEMHLSQELLEEVISGGIRDGHIKVAAKKQESLEFKGLDEYLQKYSKTLLNDIDKVIVPYLPLSGEINDMALLSKRYFPQQANCVNGVVELLQHKNHAILNEGMGCGKTIQGIGSVELYHIREYMKKHPKVTLEEMYRDPEAIKYRAIVMAPSHLVEKWKEEIEAEIIYANVKILKTLSDVMEIQAAGKKPSGKEWYIVSKEFIKLGELQSPSPTIVWNGKASLEECADCRQRGNLVIKDFYGKGKCPECGGKNWVKNYHGSNTTGLTCPRCSELLIKPGKFDYDMRISLEDYVLEPKDFGARNSSNGKCYHCGTPLWGSYVNNIANFSRKTRWEKISYLPTKTAKKPKTAWVLPKYLGQYLEHKQLKRSEVEFITSTAARKYSPAMYMKKYMKGYFDFCVLDEAHKYENGGTAQTHAAHVLTKISKKCLALTGTIANGYAKNLFYLFWMLCPKKMIEKGYRYSDVSKFSKDYGNVQTVYQYNGSEFDEYNKGSRGKQIQSPTAKPGISPLLYIEFLMGSSVQLDLEDLSNYLPPLNEIMEIVPLENELLNSYRRGVSALNEAANKKEGRGALAKMIRFRLFYTDKPYKRGPIMSSYDDDLVLFATPDHSNLIADGKLLNKEARLVEIVKKELAEKRNMFVFCECTSDEEAYMPSRLKEVLESKIPGLRGKVAILEAGKPEASKREAYMHKLSDKGIKVFICNPTLVETGLDFIWKTPQGIKNYPTIIFYQMTYNLATLWQASRRHYRLIQKEECRTYYMASEGTIQTAVLRLMGEKQVAVSAIQGKFSSSGLSAMAKGVDARLVLAKKLQEAQETSTEEIKDLFETMNRNNNDVDKTYANCKPMQILSEVIGDDGLFVSDVEQIEISVTEDVFIGDTFKDTSENNNLSTFITDSYETFENVFEDVFESSEFDFDFGFGIDFGEESVQVVEKPVNPVKKKKQAKNKGQLDLFSLMA